MHVKAFRGHVTDCIRCARGLTLRSDRSPTLLYPASVAELPDDALPWILSRREASFAL